jgi:predicted secreted protein
MRFYRSLLFSMLSFCLFLPSFAAATDGSAGMKKIRVDIDSSGRRIELNAGDEIQIELQGVGGTGYAWYFDELDHDFFELIDEERRIQEKGGESVGSPTLVTWTFKAKKAGKSVIRMSYYRVWEGKDKALRRFELEVNAVP